MTLLVTGAEVAFWLLAPVMVLGALGMILARKPVHSALCLAAVMISLAAQYAAQDAPFLFAVQIIVYTGAILMLFLFVLMLVGVDAADSLVETIKGQRTFAVPRPTGWPTIAFPTAKTSRQPNPSPASAASVRCPLIVSTKESAMSTPTSISTNRNSIKIAPV